MLSHKAMSPTQETLLPSQNILLFNGSKNRTRHHLLVDRISPPMARAAA
ncbi:MAG: hypothetical protein ACK53Y_15970 [bacterium]